MQPTLMLPVTGQQSLMNQRVQQTNTAKRAGGSGGPGGGKRPRDKQYYMGAKDLLGANAVHTNKDVVMGIGAANRVRQVTSASRP